MSDDWVDAAVAVQKDWTEAFKSRDFDRLAALYADDTAFYGSTRAFYKTPKGVREYFEVLPKHFVDSDYAVPHVVRLGDDAMAATGEVMFYTNENGQRTERPFRMTHVLVRKDGKWKIATHHASPRPAT